MENVFESKGVDVYEKFLDAGGGFILAIVLMGLLMLGIGFGSVVIENMVEDSKAKRCIEMGYCPDYEPKETEK